MPIWSSTDYSIGDVNSFVTFVSLLVTMFMVYVVSRVTIEVRRYMIIKGEIDGIVPDPGSFGAMWNSMKSSKAKKMTLFGIIPTLFCIFAVNIIEFSTAGISAEIVTMKGDPVHLVGLVGEDVNDFEFDSEQISLQTIVDDTRSFSSGETGKEFGYLSLLSPNLGPLGVSSNVTGSSFVPTVLNEGDSDEGIYVHGRNIVPDLPYTVEASFCLEYERQMYNDSDSDDSDEIKEVPFFVMSECRENLLVTKTATQMFEVLATYSIDLLSRSPVCSNEREFTLGNEEIQFVDRVIELDYAAGSLNVSAICASSLESTFESCIWQDVREFNGVERKIIHFADWNTVLSGTCSTNYELPSFVNDLWISTDIDFGDIGGDSMEILASMLTEVGGDSGTSTSVTQLVDVIGMMLRLQSIQRRETIGYDPVDVVKISVSEWIVVFLLLVLVFPLIVLYVLKYVNGRNSFFLPVDIRDWSASAARHLEGGDSLNKPSPMYYDKVFAFGPPDNDGIQRLGWIDREKVSPLTSSHSVLPGSSRKPLEILEPSPSAKNIKVGELVEIPDRGVNSPV